MRETDRLEIYACVQGLGAPTRRETEGERDREEETLTHTQTHTQRAHTERQMEKERGTHTAQHSTAQHSPERHKSTQLIPWSSMPSPPSLTGPSVTITDVHTQGCRSATAAATGGRGDASVGRFVVVVVVAVVCLL